ncbi:MAG: gephyrin-like molybdotransferase Glp [Erythrobacter sp.]
MTGPLPLEDAQARLLALAPPVRAEDVAVEDSFGRVLAADLFAARSQPAADLSAMDGYALAADGGSVQWRVVGESRAGHPFARTLGPGEAIRISTGALMPQGADRVLLKEDALVDHGTVRCAQMPPAGSHVRRRGFDFEQDSTVLSKGTVLGPAQIALALAAGHARCAVAAVPRVAVLDSGDELVRDPAACGPGQVPASNGAMLAAQLAPLGVRAVRLGPVADTLEALAAALEEAEDADILVTSGGASVGDHDLVRQALADRGAGIAFWKVAIKPGKPLLVATRARGDAPPQVVIGLPGNPVSSFVTAFLFVLPLVRAAMGATASLPRPVAMRAGEDLPAAGPRRTFLRAVHDGRVVREAGSQDSSALTALAAANCLIDRPAGAAPLRAGEEVMVFPLHSA